MEWGVMGDWLTSWFSGICEPQSCAPRAVGNTDTPANNHDAPLANDGRFREMVTDESIQRTFNIYSSASANGRAIERSNFPPLCRQLFGRIDPACALSADDMNLLWDFFDRQCDGRIDLFQFGLAVKQLLAHRAGKAALIMVDFQNDFVDGSLTVEGGLDALRQANLVRSKFDRDMVWLTRDWHPPNHMSFCDNHDAQAFSVRRLRLPSGEFTDQTMWPRHCVANSHGAQWHRELIVLESDTTVNKGLNPHVDSYSGFFDNCKGYETALQSDLRSRGVSEVYVVGLAYDYCVGFTALDAKSCGFTTYVVDDCTRPVMPSSCEAMDKRLAAANVVRLDSSRVPLPSSANGRHVLNAVRNILAKKSGGGKGHSPARTIGGNPSNVNVTHSLGLPRSQT